MGLLGLGLGSLGLGLGLGLGSGLGLGVIPKVCANKSVAADVAGEGGAIPTTNLTYTHTHTHTHERYKDPSHLIALTVNGISRVRLFFFGNGREQKTDSVHW